jgi:hypothetical protein
MVAGSDDDSIPIDTQAGAVGIRAIYAEERLA